LGKPEKKYGPTTRCYRGNKFIEWVGFKRKVSHGEIQISTKTIRRKWPALQGGGFMYGLIFGINIKKTGIGVPDLGERGRNSTGWGNSRKGGSRTSKVLFLPRA